MDYGRQLELTWSCIGKLIELISDEDAASLMPEADDEELDVVIDAAIDRVLSSMA